MLTFSSSNHCLSQSVPGARLARFLFCVDLIKDLFSHQGLQKLHHNDTKVHTSPAHSLQTASAVILSCRQTTSNQAGFIMIENVF